MHWTPHRRRLSAAVLPTIPLLLLLLQLMFAPSTAIAAPGVDRERLDVIAARLTSAQPWVAATRTAATTAPTAMTEYYLDHERGVVAVGVERVTPALRDAARKTFGNAVVLHQSDRMYRQASRVDDPAPHRAGAEIVNTALRSSCTAGFAVRRSAAIPVAVMTAGHCARGLGDTFTNKGRQFGSIVQRERAPGSLDVALIGTSAAATVYIGNRTSTATARVGGITEVFDGDNVCHSGAVTAENCTGVVSGTGLCITFEDGVETCGLDRFVSPDNRRLSAKGDSGGPVYVYTTSPGAAQPAVNAVGMAVGGNSSGTAIAYHSMDMVLGFFGVSLITG